MMAISKLPEHVTQLDLIKTFAVIMMIIDHVGYYFFPEQSWFRTFGRLGGAPVWFFLIGYATSRDIPNRWLIGALILAVADFVLFQQVFAFNVLVTIVAVRLVIDPVMAFLLRSRYLFWLSLILLALFYIPTNWVSEYGSLALLCAIVGYVTRHRAQLFERTFVTKTDYHGALVFMIVAITILQTSVFGFAFVQTAFLAVFVSALTVALVTMDPAGRAPYVPQNGSFPAARILRFCGRHTLEIYVAHLLIFKVAALVLYRVGFYQ